MRNISSPGARNDTGRGFLRNKFSDIGVTEALPGLAYCLFLNNKAQIYQNVRFAL
jgi:hypothetical protein